MKIYQMAIIISLFFIVILSRECTALSLQNGDFSSGLTGWTIQGDVTVDNGEAVAGDNAATYSLLYQSIPLVAGDYTIEFDFMNKLSGNVPHDPPFAFLDTFFATLYFANDLSGFNLAPGGFDAAFSLFSLDYNGVFENLGSIGVSAKGLDWSHMSLDFHNTYNYVIPGFELFDMNYIDNDSKVRIDNVSINVIPEPATLILTGFGILALFAISLRRKKA